MASRDMCRSMRKLVATTRWVHGGSVYLRRTAALVRDLRRLHGVCTLAGAPFPDCVRLMSCWLYGHGRTVRPL
eukprot:COSAG01_NODE_255_length_20171_cov_8.232164_14_plen_73_part_00